MAAAHLKNEQVELTYTSKIGKRTMAITPCPMNPEEKCYTWTIMNRRTRRKDGSQRITFICAQCLHFRQSRKVAKHTPLPSLIAIGGNEGEMLWNGTGNGARHCCAGPKDRAEVLGTAIKRILGAQLAAVVGSSAETAASSSSAVIRLLEAKILAAANTSEVALLSQTKQAAELPCVNNVAALKKYFRRCKRKRFPLPLKGIGAHKELMKLIKEEHYNL